MLKKKENNHKTQRSLEVFIKSIYHIKAENNH